ncbi:MULTISPECIES: type II toxin-antitoxin system PemK/MazF family toxin [Clostridium]|uniref:Type II toxin-antitoxin system PemK/MazF family toxin n=1 Tax=Clostridium frigoriphilum TaxID=443253 RepID=A0ABU7UU88_9CLOT|nr:type II toxin-antitoxin system PemK/MazF family toxin [Clostridium sp. DSM 17811]MBU3098762.1 type II toxin-antitoxin system PemK/MazF family toxin [Clostridium sp. DSM 17811]
MEKHVNSESFSPSTHSVKGAIHWFSLSKPNADITSLKVRPFIIIGRTNYNSKRVLLSPVQDLANYMENGKVKYPYHVPLLMSKYDFLEKDSVILLDQVYTIAKEELFEECYMGTICDFKPLDSAILYNFDLYESMMDEVAVLLSQYKTIYTNQFSRS